MKKTKEPILTDMEFEKAHFGEVVSVVEKRITGLEEQLKGKSSELNDLIELYREGEIELGSSITQIEEEIKMIVEQLDKNRRIAAKPYFGRIIFDEESLYVGRKGIHRDGDITDQIVIDWRAPIANAYYENGLGDMSFRSPSGDDIHINLKLKRTFDISEGKLVDFFDSENATNDELLNKYLARNKQAVLGEIIATIQKEQNDIIRLSPKHNVIVQGVAGSGKTTVAMHRISFILYNFADIVKPRDFYIIGSNKILLNYITGVLPELDVEGFSQMTMEELFIRLLYEEWDKNKYGVKNLDKDDSSATVKGTKVFFERLKSFCDNYELSMISQEDVMLDPNQFVEGLENGKSGIYDRRDRPEKRKGGLVRLLSGSAIKKYIYSNPKFSMQSKIDALNAEIRDNVEQELKYKSISYTEREKKAIKRAYDHYLGDKEFKGSIHKLYLEFLDSITDMEICKPRQTKTEYDIYDLAALAYIYRRIKETDVISEAHHIVIDEAQDYGVSAYMVLNECIRDCTYTIMGDVSQNIRYDSGINDWSELREVFLTTEHDSFMMLRKSYRNTVEISNFATKILDHGDFEIYPAEPIIRHGEEPIVKKISLKTSESLNENDNNAGTKTEGEQLKEKLLEETVAQIKAWQQEGLETIAVVVRNEKEAIALQSELAKKIELRDNDLENAEFGNGVMVLPVALTKGLEFDAVLIYEPTKKAYPVDNRHAKLLYVAATRALHRLSVFYTKSLTDLIGKPVAADKVRHVIVEQQKSRPTEAQIREQEDKARAILQQDADWVKNQILEKGSQKAKQYLGEAGKASSGSFGKAPERVVTTEIKEPVVTGRDRIKAREEADKEIKFVVPEFIAEVPANLLKESGHATSSFATKWVRKEKDGIYFQSLYGITRIMPISDNVVRVSFSKGMELKLPQCHKFKQYKLYRNMGIKESSQTFEITLKGMMIRYDKYRGAITFLDNKKTEMLKENQSEPRYVDDKKETKVCYTNFEVSSSNSFHILSPKDGNMKYLNDTAYYISPGDDLLPCIIKKDKYAIIPITSSKTAFCKKPVLGTFIMQEDLFSDYYFVVADTTEKLIENYVKLAAPEQR